MGGPGGGPGGGHGGGSDFSSFGQWFEEHMAIIILIAVAVFVVLLALGTLVLWLSSRGKFMFLDGVVHNRGAVVDPWRRFRRLANSLFGFRVAFGVAGFLVLALFGAVCVAIAWPDIQNEEFGPSAVIAIILGVVLFLLFLVTVVLIGAILRDFVVSIMYLRNQRVMAAWGIFRRELGRGHVGPLIIFYLMKMVLGMGVGFAALLVMCFTCCIVIIPYIGTVILLPVFVFMRCYSLCFIERYGPEWRLFPLEVALPA